MDVITVSNSSFKDSYIKFITNKAMKDYKKTRINIYGSVFNKKGELDFLINEVLGKEIVLKTSSNIELHDDFVANCIPGEGIIKLESDLTGLKK